VVVTLWPADRGLLDDAWAAAAASVGACWPPPADLPPERDVERSAQGLRALLDAAGLTGVETVDVRWSTSVDPESLWRGAVAGVAHFGQLVATRTDAERAIMKRAFDDWSAPRRDGDGRLVLPLYALLGSGRSGRPRPSRAQW